jgi:hypothetical protein
MHMWHWCCRSGSFACTNKRVSYGRRYDTGTNTHGAYEVGAAFLSVLLHRVELHSDLTCRTLGVLVCQWLRRHDSLRDSIFIACWCWWSENEVLWAMQLVRGDADGDLVCLRALLAGKGVHGVERIGLSMSKIQIHILAWGWSGEVRGRGRA